MIALPVISLVFCILVLFLLVIPKAKEIAVMRAKSISLNGQRRDFLAKVELLSSLDEATLKKQSYLTNFALPLKKDIALILYALSEPAKKNGFSLNQFEFDLGEVSVGESQSLSGTEGSKSKENNQNSKAQESGKIGEIVVKISLSGPRTQLASLLTDLEKGLPLLEINEIEFTLIQGDMVNVTLEVTLFSSSQSPVYDPEKISLENLILTDSENLLLEELTGYHHDEQMLESLKVKLASPSASTTYRENPFSPAN